MIRGWAVCSLCLLLAKAVLADASMSRYDVEYLNQQVYLPGEEMPIDWTGNIGSGQAGAISPVCQNAAITRVNWFRLMAGLPGTVALNPAWNSACQQAALMISANNALNHNPPPTWPFYSSDGAWAAGRSNLLLGVAGTDAINWFIADYGDNNTLVGHRRWILYPPENTMGVGMVDPNETTFSDPRPATALLVNSINQPGVPKLLRPNAPTYVAWPPAGYVPASVIYPRWSLGYNGTQADFTQAKVTMHVNGEPLAVNVETPGSFLDPTIVWQPNSLPVPAKDDPASDMDYEVAVTDIKVGDKLWRVQYHVIAFQPTDIPYFWYGRMPPPMLTAKE